MELLLASYVKTVPNNHSVRGVELFDPLTVDTPGASLTEEAWSKAKRQEDPQYDWSAYQHYASRITVEHPMASGGSAVWNIKTLTMSIVDDINSLDVAERMKQEGEE